MRNVLCWVLSIGIILSSSFIFCACKANTTEEKYRLIRIHVRAHSNDEADQTVKLAVRDGVTTYLEERLRGVTEFSDAYRRLEENLATVKAVAEGVLKANGFGYGVRVRLRNEFFPARKYGDTVVESGYYDALVLELGSGQGDNWWCVVYPPLCYPSSGPGERVRYESYLASVWKKFFG